MHFTWQDIANYGSVKIRFVQEAISAFPKRQILDWTKMKEFADDNLKFNKKGRPKGLKKGRKRCGKRINCSLRAISPFSTVFSKDLYCRVKNAWKPRLVWERVNRGDDGAWSSDVQKILIKRKVSHRLTGSILFANEWSRLFKEDDPNLSFN